jgi:RNA polymerase sigma factor (sigma-70 family)
MEKKNHRRSSHWHIDTQQDESDLRQIVQSGQDQRTAPDDAWRRASQWAAREAIHRLRGRVVDGVDADDLSQDLMLKLKEGKASSFDPARRATPFVHKRLHWSCVSLIVKSARRRTGSLGEHLPVDKELPPDRAAVEDERRAKVYREVERLPDPLRRAIILRFWQGAKLKEIASVEGCSPSTACERINKAMQLLSETLRDERS